MGCVPFPVTLLVVPGGRCRARPQPSLLAQTLSKDLQAPEPTWPPTPAWHRQPEDRPHRSAASTSPTAATRGSSAPCSCPPSPPCAPTPSPTTSANVTKANRLGPGHPRPGPPPHPDPARHDPQPHPLQPTTINTATRSRLTHHIGAPPGSLDDRGKTSCPQQLAQPRTTRDHQQGNGVTNRVALGCLWPAMTARVRLA